MTQKEFLEFVSSFNKQPGEYSEEDLVKIGIEHKKLCKADKDWTKLAHLLGVDKKGETFRKWVCSKQLKDGTLPKDVTKLSGRTVNDISVDDASKNLDKQLAEMYKAKTKIRDTYNAYRRGLRDDARLEDFREFIKNSVKTLDKLPKITYSKKPVSCSKEAILMLSDLHIGVECNNFYNTYNSQIAKARLDKLADDTIRYCADNRVTCLSIVNLGDLVHGLIHISARLEQEMDTVEQVMTASELLSNFIYKIAKNVQHIIYRSCTDNHARIIADKSQNIEKDNLGKIIDWYLMQRLSSCANVIFENDNLDDSLGKFYLKSGKLVVFAHGHSDNINRSFENFIGATREFVDYGLIGHYHSQKMKNFQDFKIFVNGSIVGVDEYALSIRKFSKPSQTLLIFDNENVINYSIDLSINEVVEESQS